MSELPYLSPSVERDVSISQLTSLWMLLALSKRWRMDAAMTALPPLPLFDQA